MHTTGNNSLCTIGTPHGTSGKTVTMAITKGKMHIKILTAQKRDGGFQPIPILDINQNILLLF
jgi:hypothetical protein